MKRLSNSEVTGLLENSDQKKCSAAYQKLAECIILTSSYRHKDFHFYDGKDYKLIENKPQPIFAKLGPLLTEILKLMLKITSRGQSHNGFLFLEAISNEKKASSLIQLALSAEDPRNRRTAICMLQKLPKLSGQTEFLILRHCCKDEKLQQILYPQRLSYLDLNIDYAEIFKSLNSIKDDLLACYLIKNMQQNYCINEVIKFLINRDQHIIKTEDSNDLLAIIAFSTCDQNFGFHRLDLELLQELIKSRRLGVNCILKILQISIRHLNNAEKLYQELCRLSFMGALEELPIIVGIMKSKADKFPLLCQSFFIQLAERHQDFLLDTIEGIGLSLSIDQKSRLAELNKQQLLERMFAALHQAKGYDQLSATQKVIEDITHNVKSTDVETLRFLIQYWPQQVHSWIRRLNDLDSARMMLFSIFAALRKLSPQANTESDNIVKFAVEQVYHIDPEKSSELAALLVEKGYERINGLPEDIEKHLRHLQEEQQEFNLMLNAMG